MRHSKFIAGLGSLCLVAAALAQDKPPVKDGAQPLPPSKLALPAGFTPPVPIMFPNPDYPPGTPAPLPEGKVGLWAKINEYGKVYLVSVVNHVNPQLDASASLALSQWEFKPATKDGKPIAVQVSFDGIFESPNPRIVMNDVIRIGAPVVKPPRATYTPDPPYTKTAMKAGIEGSVHLWLVVDEHGVPQQVWIDKSLDPGLDQNAIDTVKKWRFEAAREDGTPVAVKIDVAVNFRLH